MIRVDPTRQLIPRCYGGAHLLISCSSFSSRSPPFDESSLNLPGSRLGVVGERNHAQTLPLREAGIPDSEASFLAFLGAPSDETGVATIVNWTLAFPSIGFRRIESRGGPRFLHRYPLDSHHQICKLADISVTAARLCGVRSGEIALLQEQDVVDNRDPNGGKRIGKGKKRRPQTHPFALCSTMITTHIPALKHFRGRTLILQEPPFVRLGQRQAPGRNTTNITPGRIAPLYPWSILIL